MSPSAQDAPIPYRASSQDSLTGVVERLIEVPGIGSKRLRMIQSSYPLVTEFNLILSIKLIL